MYLFNVEVSTVIERKPDHYIGSDVSVTIKTNTNGLGTANAIKQIIDGVNIDDQKIIQLMQAFKQ